MTRRQLDEAIPRVLGQVNLSDQGRKVVSAFSGGMKRRLSLAIALLHSPRLLVLDEPTVGLDPKHRIELWKAFRALAKEGSALLITTHVMDEAACCDTIVMIQDGTVIAEGTPEELMAQTSTENLEAAFLAFEGVLAKAPIASEDAVDAAAAVVENAARAAAVADARKAADARQAAVESAASTVAAADSAQAAGARAASPAKVGKEAQDA